MPAHQSTVARNRLLQAGTLDGTRKACFDGAAGAPQVSEATEHYRPAPAMSAAPVPMVGIVEMGGASLQVTFPPAHAVPASFMMPVALPQRHGCALFTHSFSGWGREAAMARVVSGKSSPCLFSGYTSSTGEPLSLYTLCMLV